MKRLVLGIAGTLALGIAASAALLQLPAAQAASPTPTSADASAAATPTAGRGGLRGLRGERRAAMRQSPVFQTMSNLRELERLYLIDGRANEIPALYQDVLARTQNPAVRQFAYRRIARNELKPGDADQAIATLRRSLEENLRRLPAQ